MGRDPVAMVVPKRHVTDRDRLTSELSSLCRAELAGYKQPRRFEYCDELPLGPAGKILKREIVNQVIQVANSVERMSVTSRRSEEAR
ncbi:hypothetical protein I553_4935 [Mycobacterium xenopi 4042]|uniref:AMP-binding enzyme C-terminal domain-containing protein n=1 Tax=Mycobacterium xenopi 4042 TaxID=1299334 RepID=X8AI17_MYCXE|nr:hypothetical protein I553_4935 [Mycobacterium xenopi 4042]